MKKSLIFLLAILILVTDGIVIGQHLSYRYEPEGNEEEIFTEYLTEMSGYEYEEEEQVFVQTDADPNFYLQGLKNSCGGLKIELEEPAQEVIPVQVFYTEQSEPLFSERHSVSTVIEAGEESCYLKLPGKFYQTLRFDIDGDFILKRIISYDAVMHKTPIVTEEAVQSGLKALPVIVLFYVLLVYAHHDKRKQMPIKQYIKSIFAGNPMQNRAIHLDYLRVFAAVMIIISHSVSNEMASTAEGSVARFLFVAILTLGVCSNVTYVMISGHLLLASPKREERVSEFYIRRVAKVVIPLIAYYVFLLCVSGEISLLPPRNLSYALKSILTGAPDVAPHFWLLYTFVALYLATPFFKVCVQNLSDSMLLSMSIVILIMNSLTTYLPLAGVVFGVSTFLAGWEGVYLLGYILQKDSFRRYDKKLILAACISYIISLLIVFRNYGAMNYIYVCAPPTVITTCGIFAFVRQHAKWFSKDSFFLRMCSKYSFSILMIHWYTLFAIVEGRFKLSVMRGHVIGGLVVTNVVAFAVSLVFVIVFDNTVVLICNMIFDKIVEVCRRKNRKLK